MQITETTRIREVLDRCQGAAEVFANHGMDCSTCLGADTGTIEDAAVMHNVPVGDLLRDLNRLCKKEA